MIKEIKTSRLLEGDWLYKNVKIGKKTVKASWDGLNKQDIEKIKARYTKVKIKQGIVYSPVFLISFLILVIMYFLEFDFWNIF